MWQNDEITSELDLSWSSIPLYTPAASNYLEAPELAKFSKPIIANKDVRMDYCLFNLPCRIF